MKCTIYFKENNIFNFYLKEDEILETHLQYPINIGYIAYISANGDLHPTPIMGDGIMKRVSSNKYIYIPESGDNMYIIYTDENFGIDKIEYSGFAGSIFIHAWFTNINIAEFVDVKKTSSQDVYSCRLNQNLNILEYLKNHLEYQETQYYSYYVPQSPLLDILTID